jgi:hypothetical protein
MCHAIQIKGRKGWGKELKADGYEHLYSVFEKRVSE